MRRLVSVALVALGLAVMPGCFVAVDHHDRGDNLLTVEWTIDGYDDPDDCVASAVDHAYIEVESRDGYYEDREVNCENFADDFYVPDGSYWVTVTLRDRYGDDRTTPAETDSRRLFGNDDYVSINFDDRSFL